MDTTRTPQERLDSWSKLALVERMTRVSESFQKVKDSEYSSDCYHYEAKYQIGDPVAVCFQGVYYNAVIQKMEKPYDCPDTKKKVPMYSVKFPGWGEKNMGELLVEYDVIGTTKHTVTHELLYAHYSNKVTMLDGKLKKNQLKGVFEIASDVLVKLEEKWAAMVKLENPGRELTFAQWIGLEATPPSLRRE